jgi:hypothetical protein
VSPRPGAWERIIAVFLLAPWADETEILDHLSM